eukprot:SM000026S08873  [mRNA]  locus=s26:260198:263977:+ [translate_table: standard]
MRKVTPSLLCTGIQLRGLDGIPVHSRDGETESCGSQPLCPADFDWSKHYPASFDEAHDATGLPSAAAADAKRPDGERGGTSAAAAQNGRWGGGDASPDESAEVALPRQDEEAAAEASCSGSVAAHGAVPRVQFADIGCGFGGLLVTLAPLYPNILMVGLELRDKVSEYVRERIDALRLKHPGKYTNITAIRTNAMKYLPNYFEKGQLTKMFFLFPDPHFKEKNHRRRIISQALLAEYAYVLAPGGVIYTITDVEELGEWMASNISTHPLFERMSASELADDIIPPLLIYSTEEGQKVERNGGRTYSAHFRRR